MAVPQALPRRGFTSPVVAGIGTLKFKICSLLPFRLRRAAGPAADLQQELGREPLDDQRLGSAEPVEPAATVPKLSVLLVLPGFVVETKSDSPAARILARVDCFLPLRAPAGHHFGAHSCLSECV